MGTVPPLSGMVLWLTLLRPAGLIEAKPPERNGGGNALAGDCPQPRVLEKRLGRRLFDGSTALGGACVVPALRQACDGRRDTLRPRSVYDSRGASKMRMKLP